MSFVRNRIPRLLERSIGVAFEHFPRLEQLVGRAVDSRRLHIALTRLRRGGANISVVYDIGAHRGAWTRSVHTSLPDAHFFLFEANEVHADALRETGHPYFLAVLSSVPRLVDFYAIGGTGDSYFREASRHYADVKPRAVHAKTLDALVEQEHIPEPDFIKADVQGAELDVLRGGERALASAKLALLECPFIEYNEDAPTIGEYVAFLRERGFTPVEFLSPTWLKDRMTHVDILFANAAYSKLFR
jgi:FkbM family methyltransferase